MDISACCENTSSENVRHCGLLPSNLPCVDFGVEDLKNNLSDLLINGDETTVQPSLSSESKSPLVSAMKGSREKQGKKPDKELHVKWAPDVYDPVPSSVSHVPTNKAQSHGRKNGKKKNKHKSPGKSSRGSKGKDKKQGRKYGGSSERGLYLFDEHSLDLDVDSPDMLCGSSFLRSSGTKLHFPFAEAK